MLASKDVKKGANQPEVASSPEEEAVKTLAKELREAEANRRQLRRTLNQYDRVKKRFTQQLEKLTDAESTKDADTDKEIAIAVYRLLRNFCISYNTIEMVDRNEDKQVFPSKFEADLKSILIGDVAIIGAFQDALKADDAKESINALPAKIDEKSIKLLNEFLDKKEGVEVLQKLEAKLDSLTKDIDAQREDLQVKKADLAAKQPKKEAEPAARKAKKEKKSGDSDKSTEERFRTIIQEINQRVTNIKFEKDDYKLYSEVQGEIDCLVSEAIQDIQKIKTNLKKRFETVQSGKSQAKTRKRSTSRQPRNKESKNGDNADFGGMRPRK